MCALDFTCQSLCGFIIDLCQVNFILIKLVGKHAVSTFGVQFISKFIKLSVIQILPERLQLTSESSNGSHEPHIHSHRVKVTV